MKKYSRLHKLAGFVLAGIILLLIAFLLSFTQHVLLSERLAFYGVAFVVTGIMVMRSLEWVSARSDTD